MDCAALAEGEAMTTTLEICRMVVDDGNPTVDSVYDRLQLTRAVGDALVSKLCRDGILKRTPGGRLVGVNPKELAQWGDKKPPLGSSAPVPPFMGPIGPVLGERPNREPKERPTRAAPKPYREFPVPAKVELREGVPCPPPRTMKLGCPWPFGSMKPGMSFAIDVPEGWTAHDVAGKLSRDATNWRRKHPDFQVAVRILEGGKKVGLWRESEPPKPVEKSNKRERS